MLGIKRESLSESQAQAVPRETAFMEAFTDSDLPARPSLRAVATDAAALALADLTSLSSIAEASSGSAGESESIDSARDEAAPARSAGRDMARWERLARCPGKVCTQRPCRGRRGGGGGEYYQR